MKIRYEKTLGTRKFSRQGDIYPVEAVAWSPDNKRVAYCDDDRTVWVYDDNGELLYHFPTKPVEKEFGKNSYVVTCMDFSPDSTRLALGQSDEVVYVYRLPKDRDKSELAVVAKYVQTSAVTALVWTSRGHLVFGLQDGQVRLAAGNKNSTTVHEGGDCVISVLCSSTGAVLVSCHADGSIFTYTPDKESVRPPRRVLTTPKPPACVAFTGDFLLVGGVDNVITVYDLSGKRLQEISSGSRTEEIQLTAATAAPSGQYVVFAAYNTLKVFSFASKKGLWSESGSVIVENLYVVPALAWKKDGTKLLAVSLFGAVDIFDCALRKQIHNNRYEITHLASDQVLLRDMQNEHRLTLRSESGSVIEKVVVLKDLPLVVATTADHLLVMSTETGATSQVVWTWKADVAKPMFHLEGQGCVVYFENSLFVIELGRDEVLATVPTTNFYARFFSLHIDNPKTFACLSNRRTIRVIDLEAQRTIATLKHELDLDWVTLNSSCTVVVARDVRYSLMVFHVASKEKTVLCQKSDFVELVEGTDVLVAHEGKNARAWYGIGEGKTAMTEKSVAVEGKVTEVTRGKNSLLVHTQDGSSTHSYTLEDDVAQFESALQKNQLDRALDFLQAAPESPLKDGNWKALVVKSLDTRNFGLAEKIFTALKDPRAKEVKDLVARTEQLQKERGRPLEEILGHYTVKATLERLKGDLSSAEQILLSQRDHKRAIVMQSNAENYVRALTIAQEHEAALVPDLISKYQQQLTREGKHGPLALLLAHIGHLGEAAALYLNPPLKPLEAYKLIVSYPGVLGTVEGKSLAEQLLPVLQITGVHDMVGRVMELQGRVDEALKAYRAAHSYEHAIEYARQKKPEEVVPLEMECARYLTKIHKWQDAITHYIEANMNVEALDAAIHCLDFKKAAQILTVVEDEKVIQEYGKKLALFFQDREELTEAVEMYRKIGQPKDAIRMYLSRGKVDEAHQYAETIIKNDEIKDIFHKQAQVMITEKKYADAERMLLAVDDVDGAISLYQDTQQFQKVIALTKKYKEHMLNDTYIRIAEDFRKSGSFRQAELYYTKAVRFKQLVQMYVEEEKWGDAYRCAQEYIKEMADDILYIWIGRLDFKEGLALLRSLGAAKEYIRTALKSGEFDNASLIAKEIAPEMLNEVLVQRGNALAETGRFDEAERDYLTAGQPNHAIQMYIDAGNWPEAIRLTRKHFPDEEAKILMARAVTFAEQGRYQEAEQEFVNLNQPEQAISMYKAKNMFDDAIRVAREFRPAEAHALEMESNRSAVARPRTVRPGDQLLKKAREREENSDYSSAVRTYLQYLNESGSAGSAQLLRVCARVRELASSFLGEADARQALEAVADKLLSLDRTNQAAVVLLQLGQQEKALEILMDAGSWEDARSLVLRLQDPQLTKMLDARYKQFLRTQGKVEQLATVDAASAVEIYARNGEWEKCLKVCMELRDAKLLSQYLYEYGLILMKNGEEQKALELFSNYNAPVTHDIVGLYRHIFHSFLAKSYGDVAEGFRTWVSLRDLIFTAGENMVKTSSEVSVGTTAEFEKMLQIASLYANHFALISEEATKDLGWMVLLSLLRYSDVISPDRAFYDAGRAARELKWSGTADVLLNFYLDWRECIIHQNIGLVDYSQFAGADIPTNVTVPTESTVPPEAFEEVKTWIMKAALDRNLKFELKKDERGVFEISLSGGRYPPCVLTGYPVLNNGMKLGTSGRYARKTDLNRFLQAIRSTRSEKLEDVRRFLVKWCGAATELNYAFV